MGTTGPAAGRTNRRFEAPRVGERGGEGSWCTGLEGWLKEMKGLVARGVKLEEDVVVVEAEWYVARVLSSVVAEVPVESDGPNSLGEGHRQCGKATRGRRKQGGVPDSSRHSRKVSKSSASAEGCRRCFGGKTGAPRSSALRARPVPSGIKTHHRRSPPRTNLAGRGSCPGSRSSCCWWGIRKVRTPTRPAADSRAEVPPLAAAASSWGS